MEQCPDCFKEQLSINDRLKENEQKAQYIANEQKKPVAIMVDGSTQVINGTIPAGTRQIVNPLP